MNKLMAANLARLKKDKVFWLGIAFLFVFCVIILMKNYQDSAGSVAVDNFFFGYTMFVSIVSAIFCSLYLGTEYSDGTIRNKLIVGHPRGSIYLSNLIVCIVANLLMMLAWLIPAVALGFPLFGSLTIDIKTFLLMFTGSLIMIAALAAVFTLISMLVQNKAFAAVAAVVGIFVLIFAATYIANALDEPASYPGYEMGADSSVVSSEEVPNPNYLSGTKRTVYETILDIIPTGQALQYMSLTAIHLWRMPLYSLAILIITTSAGIFVFRKKDIK